MSIAAEIEKLLDLKNAGVLTDAEFLEAKRKLLDGGSIPAPAPLSAEALRREQKERLLSKILSLHAPVTADLKDDIRAQLAKGEEAIFFQELTFGGNSAGCGCSGSQSSQQRQWILLTPERVLYSAGAFSIGTTPANQPTSTRVVHTGSIRIDQISYAGVATFNKTVGCHSESGTSFTIRSSGGDITIRSPSAATANHVVEFVNDIIREMSE
jgi:hypothetical protein